MTYTEDYVPDKLWRIYQRVRRPVALWIRGVSSIRYQSTIKRVMGEWILLQVLVKPKLITRTVAVDNEPNAAKIRG